MDPGSAVVGRDTGLRREPPSVTLRPIGMSNIRMASAALTGAAFAAAPVVLVSRPWRMLQCATPSASGETACQDRRAWDWPGALDVGIAAVIGALIATALVVPFLRRG